MSKILGEFLRTPYTVERGGKSGHVAGGGGTISFDEKIFGVTESYDGQTLRPDGGYVGADGKSSLLHVTGSRSQQAQLAKMVDVDGKPNLKVDLEVDGEGKSRICVSNPGENGALGVLSFEFGQLQDRDLFGTTRSLAEQAGKVSYLRSGEQYGLAIEGGNGTIALIGNEQGRLGSEEAPPGSMPQLF